MDQEDLRSKPAQHNTDSELERKVFDVMRNENVDFTNDFFSFKNVLLTALVLGTLILICYAIGNFV